MKVAFLIQCHKNADQVNKLIDRLSSSQDGYCTDFYVHVDAKSDIAKDIKRQDNVVVLSKRIDVKWGQISQVDATLNLIEAAVGVKKDYDFLWLISGQDYPIKSNEEIVGFLKNNRGKNFIEVVSVDGDDHRRYLKRNQTWYPTWGASPVFIMRVLRKIYNILTGGKYHSIIKRKNVLNAEWRFGSQWWTLTEEACKMIIEQSADGKYRQYFKNCICPDESYFQTMLWNSPLRATLTGNNLCYVDWSEHKKNPKVLDEGDFEKLTKSDKLIARKFDAERSCGLIVKLDAGSIDKTCLE